MPARHAHWPPARSSAQCRDQWPQQRQLRFPPYIEAGAVRQADLNAALVIPFSGRGRTGPEGQRFRARPLSGAPERTAVGGREQAGRFARLATPVEQQARKTSFRAATSVIRAPGSSASATMRSFSLTLQRRRRSLPVMISTVPNGMRLYPDLKHRFKVIERGGQQGGLTRRLHFARIGAIIAAMHDKATGSDAARRDSGGTRSTPTG